MEREGEEMEDDRLGDTCESYFRPRKNSRCREKKERMQVRMQVRAQKQR